MINFISFVSAIVEGLHKFVTPLLFYVQGKNNEREKKAKANNKVLARQRDNNVYSISDADTFWDKLRERED